MSLQFILGNSGSGKTHYLYQTMIEEARLHPERNYIVIVPEQFTMQTQKDLVMMHPDGGIMNIDVLSFRRLAHRIFEETGEDRRSVLTETGKNLMLRKVAEEQKEHLTVLGQKMNLPGYVSEVKSLLSELMQYEITDFDLCEMEKIAGNRPLLLAKLGDVRLLYREFLGYQRDRFMKPEELLDVLCIAAVRSELLKNSTLAFDGFTGFTPSQVNVLEVLAKVCPKLFVTVTIDGREKLAGAVAEHELFALSKKTIRTVTDAARNAGTEIEEPVILGKRERPRFTAKGELDFLEQHLFRPGRAVYPATRTEGRKTPHQEGLSLHSCATPQMEVHFAARTISRLVREEKLRYKEIAIITGDLNSYHNYIRQIFPVYGVPAFVDETKQILLNPCLEFVRGVLQMLWKNFEYESVFRWIRTGMSGLCTEEADLLENYVLAAGIRGWKKWNQVWEYIPYHFTEEQLEDCNRYREQILVKLGPFVAALGSSQFQKERYSVRLLTDALYELLVACDMQQELKNQENRLSEAGAYEQAREYSQIYAILIGLLEEMVDLLGEETVTVWEYAQILDAGFSEAKVGIIPPGIDEVQVGDIQRSRLNHVKVLIFLGLNDGWVPKKEDGGGIVSDLERELLKAGGVELAPTARENSYTQRFYLYQNLTKPEKRLYLSWSEGTADGAKMHPSYLISVVRKLFPDITQIKEADAGTKIDQIITKENGFYYLTQGLSDVRAGVLTDEWKELYRRYRLDDAYAERTARLLEAAFPLAKNRQLSYTTTKKLYGEVLQNSITRLEQFAGCAFAHFISYGLKLQERELYGIKPADIGMMFHHCLERYSRAIVESGRDWKEISQEEQEAMMDQCVDEMTAGISGTALKETARDAYTISRLKRILHRTVWVLNKQICAGRFRPSDLEVQFRGDHGMKAVNVSLLDGSKMELSGRIDRIDKVETEDKVYVKIVDYKSGKAEFNAVDVYYGLQLQLVVYLNAAMEYEQRRNPGKEIIPAGIFYHHLDDPMLMKENGKTEEEVKAALQKELRPEGILNEDGSIIRMMDEQIGKDSVVIHAGYTQSGALNRYTKAVSTEEFDHLRNYVHGKMQEMGTSIMAGDIAVRPFEDQGTVKCDYCAYSDICGADRRIPGSCEIRRAAVTKEEAWDHIMGRGKAGEADECD